MNPEAESTDLRLSWTRRAIQGLTRRHRAVNEIAACPGARLARPALLVVVLAISAAVAVPASALTRRASRVVVNRGQATRLKGWQRRTVDPLMQAPHSAGGTSTLGPGSPFSGFGSSLVGSAPVGNGPSTLAINPATHTIYVANGYNDNGDQLPMPGNTVSVIDERHCQRAGRVALQGPVADHHRGKHAERDRDRRADRHRLRDQRPDNTVSVFNGATCNAKTAAGCGQTPATVPVGLDPLGLFADPDNHTVYVANYGAPGGGPPGDSTTVSMIDSATCNASNLAACPKTAPPTVDVGASPNDVEVDQATHTVYVTTIGALSGWSVFDANTCNATVQSGCATIGYLTGDPIGPNAAQVDTANDTLYTANFDTTVSAFDLHHCNAGDLAGCASDVPGTVTVPGPGFGDHALWLAVDAPLHSVYVVYQKDDALKVIDTNLCSGTEPAGCATLIPPEVHTGADPESVILDPRTQTLYTANWVDNDVSVIDASRCNAQTTSGCRHPAPTFGSQPGALAADAAAHTLYDTSGANSVSMINTSACNSYSLAGCAQTPATVNVGEFPNAVAVNHRTHTVYVANSGSGTTGTVSVIDARTCNSTDQAGCANLQTLQVPGGNPDDIAVDPGTDTIYVATITGSGPDLVSVFNGATCNATDTGGCDQTPATLAVGNSGGRPKTPLSTSPSTKRPTRSTHRTSSTSDPFPPPFLGNSVYVINGATCDATNTTGCGQTPAIVTLSPNPPIGSNPLGIAVDQATDTIYTANIADGEYPGTVSVINGATCNGQDTSGCGQSPASAPAGFGANGIAIDHRSHRVYVTNQEDTSVSVIDGAACNSQHTSGCSRTPPKIAVGDYPGSIAVDPKAGTAYVSTLEGVSVDPLTR